MPTTIRMTRLPRPVQIASAVIAAVLLNSELASGQTITLINPGTDDRIQSITNLDIAGTTYDITFQHGVSFNALSGTQITFNTQATATVAYNAIEAFIDGTNINHPATRTTLIAIPFTSNVSILFENSAATDPYDFGDTPRLLASLDPNLSVATDAAYLTFAPTAVPEPTTFALAGTLSLGAVALRRRRNRLSADSRINP